MFDFKILLLIAPVWLGVVIITLWTSVSLPRARKTVEALLEKNCSDEFTALTLKDLGLPAANAALLRRSSSLRRVVDAAGESRDASGAAQTSPEPRYYISPRNAQRAKDMYLKKRGGLAQAAIMLLVFTAALVLIWIAASLVFDTSTLRLPFRN